MSSTTSLRLWFTVKGVQRPDPKLGPNDTGLRVHNEGVTCQWDFSLHNEISRWFRGFTSSSSLRFPFLGRGRTERRYGVEDPSL